MAIHHLKAAHIKKIHLGHIHTFGDICQHITVLIDYDKNKQWHGAHYIKANQHEGVEGIINPPQKKCSRINNKKLTFEKSLIIGGILNKNSNQTCAVCNSVLIKMIILKTFTY